MPPHGYLLQRRLEYVEHMLRETQLPLSEIALTAGFFRPEPSRSAFPPTDWHVPKTRPPPGTISPNVQES